MSCNCATDLNDIRDCSPFANRNDVIEALGTLQECCKIVYNDCDLDPTASDAQAQEIITTYAPDGVETCRCDCVFMYNQCDGAIYINCSDDLGVAANWCAICSPPDCTETLTTVGLDPSNSVGDAAAAVLEGFGVNGVPADCDIAYLVREDGTICTSIDLGATWDCGGAAAGGIAVAQNINNGQSQIPINAAVNPVQIWRGTSLNNGVDAMKVAGEVYDPNDLIQDPVNGGDNRQFFNPTATGAYRVKFCYQYRAPANATGATRDWTLNLRDDTGAIVDNNGVLNRGGDEFGDAGAGCYDEVITLDAARDYRFTAINSGAVATQNGAITRLNFSVEFLG